MYPDLVNAMGTPEAPRPRNGGGQLRIQEIVKIKEEINQYRNKMHDKIKRISKHTKGLDVAIGVTTSMGVAGSVAAATVSATGVGIIVGLPLGLTSAVVGAIGMVMQMPNKYYKKKLTNYMRLNTIANQYYIQICDIYSTILDDGKITDEEFKTVLELYKRYNAEISGIRVTPSEPMIAPNNTELEEQVKKMLSMVAPNLNKSAKPANAGV